MAGGKRAISFDLGGDLSREAIEQRAENHIHGAWSIVYSQGIDDGLDLTYKLATWVATQRRVIKQICSIPAREAANWLHEKTGAPIVSCRSVVRIIHSARR